MKTPNILYIFTDQQFGGAMGCAGNTELSTPNIDMLAADGVVFDKAYCTFPLCGPSRASMFTGKMPHEVGIMSNAVGIDEIHRKQAMGQIFSDHGYDCIYGGKWHIPTMSITEEHGFRKISDFNDDRLAEACIDYLEKSRNQPFLMVASFDNPHNICEWARDQALPWGGIVDRGTEDCPSLPANHPIAPYEPSCIRIEVENHPRVYTGSYSSGPDWWRHYINAYYRLIEKVDTQIGRIITALKELNLYNNTVIIFSSDHGDAMGAHQLQQKSFLYEESVRVPFIIAYKDITNKGMVDKKHLVSNGLDLLPTVCDYAGIDIPCGLEGISLKPIVEGNSHSQSRDSLVSVTKLGTTQGRMLRTHQYKYITYDWGFNREQLFDLDKDPGEMVNLANNNQYKTVLNKHRDILMEWCIRSKDTFGKHYGQPGKPMIPGNEYCDIDMDDYENS